MEVGAAITSDGCKAIHGKLSNEFIAAHWLPTTSLPPSSSHSAVEQKRVRVKIAGVDAIRWLTLNFEPLGTATNMEPPTVPRLARVIHGGHVEPRFSDTFLGDEYDDDVISSDRQRYRPLFFPGRNGRENRSSVCVECRRTTPK